VCWAFFTLQKSLTFDILRFFSRSLTSFGILSLVNLGLELFAVGIAAFQNSFKFVPALFVWYRERREFIRSGFQWLTKSGAYTNSCKDDLVQDGVISRDLPGKNESAPDRLVMGRSPNIPPPKSVHLNPTFSRST
jgi:hypothetical protein